MRVGGRVALCVRRGAAWAPNAHCMHFRVVRALPENFCGTLFSCKWPTPNSFGPLHYPRLMLGTCLHCVYLAVCVCVWQLLAWLSVSNFNLQLQLFWHRLLLRTCECLCVRAATFVANLLTSNAEQGASALCNGAYYACNWRCNFRLMNLMNFAKCQTGVSAKHFNVAYYKLPKVFSFSYRTT